MAFELGVYSFGNTPVRDGGGLGPTSPAIRDVLGAIRLAEEEGRTGMNSTVIPM